jgi:hypothetical protein
MTALDENYQRDIAHGTSSRPAYFVEARMNYSEPMMIGKQIFDNRWRRVTFDRGEIGVPAHRPFEHRMDEHQLLTYPASQALRWWLHAAAEVDFKGTCLESRLVRVHVSESYKIEAVSTHEHIQGEDRSNCIPDWGSKKSEPKP